MVTIKSTAISTTTSRATSNTIVEVSGLTKRYGASSVVDNVSFTLEANKIYGLLGRNGAGKTTLMQMLTAQVAASEGQIRLFGEPPYENNRVLSQVCFIKESQKYPDNYRVTDAMRVAELFFPNWDAAFAAELLSDFRLPPRRKIKKLSRGMLSSVGIIIGLASRAPLTIFDEPYLGLDASARELFYDRLLDDYGAYPRTVILSTHLIDEVNRLLEHVLLLDGGQLLVNEETDQLRQRACSVAGSAAGVEAFLQGKSVLHRAPLGGLLQATAMVPVDAATRKEAEALGLELAPISLQQLFVQLTREQDNKRKGREGA